jgi:hypothetical protein
VVVSTNEQIVYFFFQKDRHFSLTLRVKKNKHLSQIGFLCKKVFGESLASLGLTDGYPLDSIHSFSPPSMM